jgi:glutamine cyclotransferase
VLPRVIAVRCFLVLAATSCQLPPTNASRPDAFPADIVMADVSVPDASMPDIAAPDVFLPDIAALDVLLPDVILADAVAPDSGGLANLVFDPGDPPVHGCLVIGDYPHDPAAFTQGLLYHGGYLYEGTGLRGLSSVRRVSLQTGSVVQQYDLRYNTIKNELSPAPPAPSHGPQGGAASDYFGEGIALFGGQIIQLTWQSQVGFIYDQGFLEPQGWFAYDSEGWGLTHDGTHLIQSDGTAVLRFRFAATSASTFFQLSHSVQVSCSGALVDTFGNPLCQYNVLRNLNELEYAGGKILANVWYANYIAVIDPLTGAVGAWIDLGSIAAAHAQEGVPNGIAYDKAGGRLFVTGKQWSKLYEIELVSPGSAGT